MSSDQTIFIQENVKILLKFIKLNQNLEPIGLTFVSTNIINILKKI